MILPIARSVAGMQTFDALQKSQRAISQIGETKACFESSLRMRAVGVLEK